jgi:sugar phosphate isomerase/epimerase
VAAAQKSLKEETMRTIKGPAIFLAQFESETAPFNTLPDITRWVAGLGYKGVQIPTWTQLIDLERAAESRTYCDEIKGMIADRGLAITELSTHLQGQLVAVDPTQNTLFDVFSPKQLHGKPEARQAWARQQLMWAARASANLGLSAHATFSGALIWNRFYPWPPRSEREVKDAFVELARLWRPILNAFDDAGVDVAFEIHPGEDLHDGATFERFLDAVEHHPRASILYDPSHLLLQQLDYLAFIDLYHERIRAFHVKDAEFRPNGRSGVYGGYQSWANRPGRFRSLGDGQIDFRAIFSKMAQYNFPGWAVLEWECCFKHPEDGAREGAPFIAERIIRVTDKQFDDFAAV